MAELRSDPKNANRGTVRGRGMLERSLSQYGAGRAPVASADGVILAGNKTVEVARELGIPVKEIESDGRTLFVIRRTDLPYDDPRARELAIADNRTGEVSLEWAPEVLAALADDGVDLGQFWFEDELADVLSDPAPWSPALEPGMSTQSVTGEQIAAARGKLDEQFKRERALEPVMCPHCGNEFFLEQGT